MILMCAWSLTIWLCSIKVIGIPDDRLGEQVCACIKLKEGHTATEEDIKQFCKGKVSISNDDVTKGVHIKWLCDIKKVSISNDYVILKRWAYQMMML